MKIFNFEIKKASGASPENIPPKTAEYYTVSLENPRNLYDTFTNRFSNANPDYIKEISESARKGVNFYKALLFDEIMRRDLRLSGLKQTRKLAVLGKKYKIKCENEEIKTFAENQLRRDRKNPVIGRKGITKNVFSDIVEASIQGLTIFEMNFFISKGKWNIKEMRRIPNHIIVYDDRQDAYHFLDMARFDANQIDYLSSNVLNDRVDIHKFPLVKVDRRKIIEVHSYDGDASNGFLNGCTDSLIWGYFFKNFTIKDLSIFLERFATPILKGEYDELMGDVERDALKTFLKELPIKKFGTHPSSARIDVLNDTSKGTASKIFLDFINFWNKEMSIRVLGQELTTDIGGIGSKSASDVADRVRGDIVIADLELVTETVNEIFERLLFMNYAEPPEIPEIEFEDLQRLKVLRILSEIYVNIKAMGYKVNREQVAEIFGVDVEEIPEQMERGQGQAPKSTPDKDTAPTQAKAEEDIKQIASSIRAALAGEDLSDKQIDNYLRSIYKLITEGQ